MKMANKLKPLQWEKIISGASALLKQKKVVAVIDVDAIPSSDFSLVDGDEDLQVKDSEEDEGHGGSDYY